MGDRKLWTGIQWLCHGPTALSRVTNPNPGLEYEKNMVYEDFLNMGILPLECLSQTDRYLTVGLVAKFKAHVAMRV